ncbi:MAG: hypothetical protein ACQGVC_04355 [Myxococcota bacterium]
MPDPVFCPECRAEYLWSATRCGDCDVALVSESALGDASVAELPPASELVCIRAAAVGWCQGLSVELSEAGIAHRIEVAADDEEDGTVRRPGANLPYGVYVREADAAAAAEVDAAFMKRQIPDMPEDAGGGDDESCPACGEAVAASADECPECGLALLGE